MRRSKRLERNKTLIRNAGRAHMGVVSGARAQGRQPGNPHPRRARQGRAETGYRWMVGLRSIRHSSRSPGRTVIHRSVAERKGYTTA